jgi:hypothetical protein
MTPKLMLPQGKHRTFRQALSLLTAYRRASAALDLYDGTNPGPHDRPTAVDVLALNALNAFAYVPSMDPMTVIWAHRDEVARCIRPITVAPVEELTATELGRQQKKVLNALHLVEKIYLFGGTGTRTAKLLHRLRPNIIPIWDKYVGYWYGGACETWESYICQMHEDVRANAPCLHLLRKAIMPTLPILRVWDIVLWSIKYQASLPPGS